MRHNSPLITQTGTEITYNISVLLCVIVVNCGFDAPSYTRFKTFMFRILSLILLFAIGSAFQTLQAQKSIRIETTLNGDSIIIADSTGHVYKIKAPTKKKRKKVQRPQRIDRGIMQSVFIPKGQWMAGGTVSYSEHEEDNLNFLVIKNVEDLGYTFNVSPYVGYFFKDNVAAGLRFGYNRTYLDMANFELNLGEDFNISLKDLYYLEHEYQVSGFLRTYMPIGKSKIFGLFNEVRLTYAYGVGKNSTGSNTEYDGTFERTHNLQIGIAPGMTAFVTDWSAVEVSVGVMGYNFKWQKQTTNQIESGMRRTSSGNFKINLFSINIGMTFYL